MSDQQLAVTPQRKASTELASFLGMEASMMMDVIAAQCFKGGSPTNVQLAAFVSIAAEMRVNPMLPGMLYAYPIQGGGIVPMMGPDGVYKKLTEHPEVDSWDTTVFPEDPTIPPTHAISRIYRKGRTNPITYTASMSEWKVDSNPNWKTRPRHMLGIRALKQCARQIIHGLPHDEDDRVIMREVQATEIPRAQLTDTRAVEAEVIPPDKKTEPKPKAEKPKAKPEPAPEKTPAPASDPAPADKTPHGKLRAMLAEGGWTDDECVKLAISVFPALRHIKTVDEIPASRIADIIEDWATAEGAMKTIRG